MIRQLVFSAFTSIVYGCNRFSPGSVVEPNARLGVDGEVEKQLDDLPVAENLALGGPVGKLLDRHQREPNEVQRPVENGPLVLRRRLETLPVALGLRPPEDRLDAKESDDVSLILNE